MAICPSVRRIRKVVTYTFALVTFCVVFNILKNIFLTNAPHQRRNLRSHRISHHENTISEADMELETPNIPTQRATAEKIGELSVDGDYPLYENSDDDDIRNEHPSYSETDGIYLEMAPTIRTDHLKFEFYVNEENMCKEKSSETVKLLIVVYTAASELTERDFIRHSWRRIARENSKYRLIFLLGRADDIDVNALFLESWYNRDMIAADYTDTYRNLTLKSFAMFQWVNEFCSSAEYILKIDSDVEIDLTKLLNIIEYRPIPDKFNCGYIWNNNRVIRYLSKWYVPKNYYRKDIYPNYCPGPAFIMTNRLVLKLSTIPIPFRRPFPVDDAYITGILREKIKETIDTRIFHFKYDKVGDALLHGRVKIHIIFNDI